jgi:hypothetical protein
MFFDAGPLPMQQLLLAELVAIAVYVCVKSEYEGEHISVNMHA